MKDVNNDMNRELKFDTLTEKEFEIVYQACGFSLNFVTPHTSITKDEKGRVIHVEFEKDHTRNMFQLYKIGKPCESIEIQYTDDTHFICTIKCKDKTVYMNRYFIADIFDSKHWFANMTVYRNETTIRIITEVSETFVDDKLTRVDIYNTKPYTFYNFIEKSILYLNDKAIVNTYEPPSKFGFENVSALLSQNNNPIKETQIYYNIENGSIDFTKPDITLSNTKDITSLSVKTRKNKSEISLLDILDKYYRD